MKRDYTDEESIRMRTELFNRFVVPHKNLIFKLCIKYSFYPMEIEDNYNEVLINFFRYIDTYDPDKPIQTWLHVVTKRFVMDLNIKQRRYKLVDRYKDSDSGNSSNDRGDMVSFYISPDGAYEQYDEDILLAIYRLKPIYRTTILLRYKGYKLKEIMQISYEDGILKSRNLETVKSRIYLAKKELRKMLTRDGRLIN